MCDEGYIGLGQDCHAPKDFAPQLLLPENSAQAAEIHVAAFDADKVAVVFRDKAKGHGGAVVVGTVGAGGALELSPVEYFTAPGAKAFAPVVAGTEGRRLAIAWRDDPRAGACKLRAASLGGSGIRGAEMAWRSAPVERRPVVRSREHVAAARGHGLAAPRAAPAAAKAA